MKLAKDLVIKVVNGLESGAYEAWADEPAEGDEKLQDWINEISNVMHEGGENGKYLVLALAEFAEQQSADVTSGELADYIQEHHQGAGFNVGGTLEEYAKHDDVGELGKFYNALDKAGGVDYFDWEEYADSGSSYMSGLSFIVVPTTGVGVHSVYLFSES